MIPGPFEYHRPASIDEAVALVGQFGDEGKILAGGHSLIPMMKLRLAQPSHLIDINRIAELKGIREDGGALVIGAATTQAEALASALLADKCPIIGETVLQVADPQVRNCGTLGGNVANGDPGNDFPAVMMALDATYVLRGANGSREVAARQFYHGTYDTALEDGELLIEIRIPAPGAGHGWGYRKMKRKVGDFAIAAAAVTLTMSGGSCARAAVVLTNVADAALLCEPAGASLEGSTLDEAAITAAAEAVRQAAQPVADLRGPVEFRKSMAAEMARRAIEAARDRAQGS